LRLDLGSAGNCDSRTPQVFRGENFAMRAIFTRFTAPAIAILGTVDPIAAAIFNALVEVADNK
jgi:hypothetical protein